MKNLIIVFSMGFLLTACGGYKSNLSPAVESNESILDGNLEYQKVLAETELISMQVDEIYLEISKQANSSSSKVKMSELKKLTKDYQKNIQKIIDSLNSLKSKINDQINILDPGLPNYAEIRQKLEKALAQIDKVISYLQNLNQIVRDQIEKLFEKLELKLSENKNPLVSLVLKMALDILKEEILKQFPVI